VSGKILSFQAGSNFAYSDGRLDENENGETGCRMVCEDNKFDGYVLAAADKIGEPKYCAIAWFPNAFGARNCQSWVRDVLEEAIEKYLENEECPKCFG
jgi:hypothetical protein